MSKALEKKITFKGESDDFFLQYLSKKLDSQNISNEDKKKYESSRQIYRDALKEQNSSSNAAKVESPEKFQTRLHDKEVKSEAISNLVNLIYFQNYFADATNRNDFKDSFEDLKSELHLERYPDFDIFSEFYSKVFDFKITRATFRNAIEKSTKELDLYANSSQNIAMRNTSYHHLLHTVEKIINCDHFCNSKKTQEVSPALVSKSAGKRLSHAIIDTPIIHHDKNNAGPSTLSLKDSKAPSDEEKKESKGPQTDEDGFILVAPKYVLVKKSKENDNKQHGEHKYHHKKHYHNKDRHHHSKEDQDHEGYESKGDRQESRGEKRYYQKKVYEKKSEQDK